MLSCSVVVSRAEPHACQPTHPPTHPLSYFPTHMRASTTRLSYLYQQCLLAHRVETHGREERKTLGAAERPRLIPALWSTVTHSHPLVAPRQDWPKRTGRSVSRSTVPDSRGCHRGRLLGMLPSNWLPLGCRCRPLAPRLCLALCPWRGGEAKTLQGRRPRRRHLTLGSEKTSGSHETCD